MPRAPHAQGDNPHPDASGVTGSYNTAHGYLALSSLGAGYYNTAHGAFALSSNTTGTDNAAVGSMALASNTTGGENTAMGASALQYNTGDGNTAIGTYALQSNTTGNFNTTIGSQSLFENTTGSNNIAVGFDAAIQVSAGNNNNIHIGSFGSPGDSGTIRIGTGEAAGVAFGGLPYFQTSFFASGIRGVTTGNNNAVPVMIDSAGQLGTVSSSRRFKEDIHDMADASDGLMRLRPVTFRYKHPFDDGSKPLQYGLIAEEVAEVYPDLVARSADGQIETVKYQLLDPMLLNEVQKQFQHAQKQDETIGQQRELLLQQQEQVSRQQQEIRSLETRLAALEALLFGKPPAATAAR
jgi:hypothetical protein